MKTWEMIKELTENPDKKFKNQRGEEVRLLPDNDLYSEGENGYNFISITDEWEEVKEPVDFMTAFKAFREGKVISVEDGELTGGKFTYYPRANKRYVAFSEEDIANGKWYIED